MCRHFFLSICVSFIALHTTIYANNSDVVVAVESILDRIYAVSTDEFLEVLHLDAVAIETITAPVLYERITQEPDLLVINVLSERWYTDCHIAGSINIPLKQLIYRIQDIPLDQPIVVYCALDACNGGQKAYILLRALGYTHVVDYPGGVKDWFQQGYPTAGPCAESYLHEPYTHRTVCLDEDAL